MAYANTPVGHFGGKKIPEKTKEIARRLVNKDGEPKAEVARTLGISIRSLYKILGSKSPDKLKEERRDKMAGIQDQAANLAKLAFSEITPEKLAKSSASQLAIIAGISTDKVEKLDRRITENELEEQGQDLDIMPDTLDAMLGAIRNLMREFDPRMLGVKFAGEMKKEVKDLEKILGKNIVEAEVEVLDEFYRPKQGEVERDSGDRSGRRPGDDKSAGS